MIEIFKVLMNEDGIEVNEDIIETAGLTIEEFSERWNQETIIKGIADFGRTLKGSIKKQEE